MDEFNRDQNENTEVTPPVQPEPAVCTEVPEAEPIPNAEPAEAQPLPNAEEPPVQPVEAAQQPYAPPYTQYPNGYGTYAMPNPYMQPPVKRKMPLGLKILLIVMSVLFAGSVVGFAVYGVYTVVTSTHEYGFGPEIPYFDPENPGRPEFPWDEDAAADPEEFVPPDIDVIPNKDGITLLPAPVGAELDVSAVYDKVIPSTVLVLTEGGTGSGAGTGIIATEDGYIITNSHVVLNSKSVSVQVKTNDGTLHDAVVVGYDKTTDLAVLKIEGSGFTPAEFGSSDDLRMGQWVLAIGNPGGEQFSGSITRGVVSGLDRAVGTYSSNGMTYIQTDAAINPGNSGGPLVNMYGQVVGISSAKIVSEQYEGMGFAIPTAGAKQIINDLLSGGYVQGRVRFGIRGTNVTEMQAAAYDVPLGFIISEIDKVSSFADTEVRPYDIITAIDGTETPSLEALSNALLAYAPGDSVSVTIFRPNETGTGGEEFDVTVVLLEDKGETQD